MTTTANAGDEQDNVCQECGDHRPCDCPMEEIEMEAGVAIYPPLREGQRVQCSICHRMTDKALADLDGPAGTFVCIGDCEPEGE